jgi:hypothetical protein
VVELVDLVGGGVDVNRSHDLVIPNTLGCVVHPTNPRKAFHDAHDFSLLIERKRDADKVVQDPKASR